MTHRVRSVFGRAVVWLGAAVLAFSLGAADLAAQQTTGKIEGTVTDQAGAPVANVQVLLVGTSFGALTNAQGYYFLNNVPVGTYTLRAQFIGYAPAEVRGVRVLGGQTITQNVSMQSSAVVLTGVTVTGAVNPLVPRDQVATKTIVSGDLVNDLPVDDVRQVIALTPGVVESGDARGVSIRGGRPGEANVYIDGAPVRGTNSGYPRMDLGTNAVEEASVTTGALGVEFSDAQSGVVAVTTRAGGERLEGSFQYETDEPFSDNMSFGINRFEASVGGPIPILQNLRFFLSGVVRGQLSQFGDDAFTNTITSISRGVGSPDQPIFVRGGVDTVVTDANGAAIALPRYVQFSGQCGNLGSSANPVAQEIQSNYGYDCQGIRRPFDWNSYTNLQGKLSYTYGSGSSVSLTAVTNGDQQRYTPYTDISAANAPTYGRDNTAGYRGRHEWDRMAILNLFHQAFRTSERALSLNLNLSWQRDRIISGPLDPESEAETRSPMMGITFQTLQFSGMDNWPFPITDQIIRDLRTNTGTRGVPLIGRSDLEVAQAGRINPYGLAGNQWYTQGLAVRASSLSEQRLTGRLVIDWQASRYHRFTAGGDVKKTDLAYWNTFDLTNQIFMDAYIVDPVQYGLFFADRLDLGDVVLEGGLRYDYYNANALFPERPGFISSDPRWNPLAATDDAAYRASLDSVFVPSVGHTALSPRLRVSFPITEQTGFRLSYSHQVQTPEFTTLLTGLNNDLSFTNTNDVFGRDLDFGKTILFEFGVRHAFSNDLVLDVSAYNKDKVSDFAARVLSLDNPRGGTIAVNVLTNRDFGNARGVDTKLDWRAGNYFSTSVSYTFQLSKNTGSDPFSYLNTFARQVSALTGERTPPPEAAQRTDNDRTHSFAAAVSFSLPGDWREGSAIGGIFRNVDLFATVRVMSGLPYTLLLNQGAGQTAPQLSFGQGGRSDDPALNQRELPWTKNVDLRINKGLRFGRLDVTAYADIRNLFNFKNVIGLFAETGDVVNEEHRRQVIGGINESGAATGEYALLYNEAGEAGAFNAADRSVNLGSCSGWEKPVNCVSLRRVESRFGDGDGIYTFSEQERAFNTYYNAFAGTWQFYATPRHVRLGVELNF